MAEPTFMAFLTEEDTDQVILALQQADENHLLWLRRLHSGLITGTPAFAQDILAEDAHRCCRFGHWYYHEAGEPIRTHQDFLALESLHEQMHTQARLLASKKQAGAPINEADYAHFIDLQNHLSGRLRALKDELQMLRCSFDSLTGLLNRQACESFIEKQYARVQRTAEDCCLALIDIDLFKSINDTYGHPVGDQAIRALAGHLRHSVRPYDTICRYGGEEFLLCLPQTQIDQALEILERLRQHIMDHPVTVAAGDIRMTASFGVAKLVAQRPLAETIRRADEALYAAKRAGRNRVMADDSA